MQDQQDQQDQPKPLRPYGALYKGKWAHVLATSSYEAQTLAARSMGCPAKKQYLVTVMLTDVVHTAT